MIRGDLEDVDALRRGMADCRWVFHLAGYAKNWSPDPTTYQRLNVDATARIFDLAAEQRVERVVWTSSCVTLGPSRVGRRTAEGGAIDEDSPRVTDRFFTEYEASKHRAEQMALARADEGLPVVIVNPTRVFGPGHLTEGNSATRLIDDYDRGRVPILLNRGVNVGNYVLVRDVAEGMILAMDRGRPGERYLLGGENIRLKELFRLVDQATGRRHFQLPLMKVAPMVFSHLLQWRAEWFGVYPTITPGWMRTFMTDWAFSIDKARRELGYNPTPLADAVRETCDWLQRVRPEAVNDNA
jgi:farnesol dehydrogenase